MTIMFFILLSYDTMYFVLRDAEIIYGKVLSQKRTRRRRKTDNSATSLAASTFQSQETSLREFNRNKV